MTFVLVFLLFMSLPVALELVAWRVQRSPELIRKLAHMSSAVLAAFLPLVVSFGEIAVLGLAFAALMFLSLRVRIFTAIHGVSRATYGEVFFPLGIAVLALLCPHPIPFAYGVLVLGLGDGLAALVGGKLGRRIVPLVQTRKTLWGSGTFLAASFAVGVALLAPTGVSMTYMLVAAALIAIVLTPVELFLAHGLDNLVLPSMAGLLVTAL